MLERDLTGIRAQPAPTPTHIAVILTSIRARSRPSALLATSSAQPTRSATRSAVRTCRASVAPSTRASSSRRAGRTASPPRPDQFDQLDQVAHPQPQRPAATTTNGSTSAASVHDRSSERCTPSSRSGKYTRSSPHVRRATTNTNSRPHHGWNDALPGQFAPQPRHQAQSQAKANAAKVVSPRWKRSVVGWRTDATHEQARSSIFQ